MTAPVSDFWFKVWAVCVVAVLVIVCGLAMMLGWGIVSAKKAAACDRRCAGLASFYGSESGTKTASGQRFNPQAMTAAHRCLPFGTPLRVTHRGRTVTVTINDRGPFIRGRVLDLSEGAARAVGITRKVGVARVGCEVL